MHISYISYLLAAVLAKQALAQQLAQTTTKDSSGKAVYIPGGTRGTSSRTGTSSVASPSSTPTLVYNCAQMPLICENVAAWSIGKGNNKGDLPQPQIFYFDPNSETKETRRETSCGNFRHDDCQSATSNGKRKGTKVTDIATSSATISAINAANTSAILAGPNPRLNEQRKSINSIPGRFFGQGVGLSCDEFPPAPFIEGGRAYTICALQSWQIYSGKEGVNKKGGAKNVGKWPLEPKTGVRMEQDWQATSHGFLREAFGVSGATGGKKGWGSVYPFSFTTVTETATSSKPWVINPSTSTKRVSKRDVGTTNAPAEPAVTMFVTGEEDLDGLWFQPGDQPAQPTSEPQLNQTAQAQLNQTAQAQLNQTAQSGSRTTPFLAARTAKPAPFDRETRTRPQNVERTAQALYPRDSDLDFDVEGWEDIEVGDNPYYDPLLPGEGSKPSCSPYITQSDVDGTIKDLDGRGDDGYPPNSCCGGGGSVQCYQLSTSGAASVQLCGGKEERCIGCSMLANYVAGISKGCVKDGKTGGSQDINEQPGLSVQVTGNTRH